MDWKFILVLIFAVIVAVFAIQNAEVADIQFLTMEWNISQALVILVSAMLGALIAFMLSAIRLMKINSKTKAFSKAVTALEEENKKLKAALGAHKEQITSLQAEPAPQPQEVPQPQGVPQN